MCFLRGVAWRELHLTDANEAPEQIVDRYRICDLAQVRVHDELQLYGFFVASLSKLNLHGRATYPSCSSCKKKLSSRICTSCPDGELVHR